MKAKQRGWIATHPIKLMTFYAQMIWQFAFFHPQGNYLPTFFKGKAFNPCLKLVKLHPAANLQIFARTCETSQCKRSIVSHCSTLTAFLNAQYPFNLKLSGWEKGNVKLIKGAASCLQRTYARIAGNPFIFSIKWNKSNTLRSGVSGSVISKKKMRIIFYYIFVSHVFTSW